MNTIKKTLLLDKKQYYEMHLSIVNAFIPFKLTKKEIEVLALFLSFDEGVFKDDRFCAYCRKEVQNKLGITTAGLSNYLKSFKEKNIIGEGLGGNLYIYPYLIPEIKEQNYSFKIQLKCQD